MVSILPRSRHGPVDGGGLLFRSGRRERSDWGIGFEKKKFNHRAHKAHRGEDGNLNHERHGKHEMGAAH